ncbi:hypothetical protein A2714_03460 [Candidatus Woesebacteria bacterium RIFCSPHIGHO2_01_FULL_38_9]|uniref:Oxidized purine nucleoside triphosphate hydrolase n=2 Tax=Candidatus Woeseibacteriota TaxID=1752722 RepID=A0A1F7Y081_9BACT|nr:MAG: hypothetical protein A2714_03460 [Candidatus Woesebacteria bacterium RIFCSPHIGHO2_01_FULL_38_9]OGM63902.1 MAG: hypothetical protein A2893_00095 [Candidatus Woesebacteria bacterium RIFCSPLOWO2_01_FULL_39_25]
MKLVDYKKKFKEPLRQATLCFLILENKILLARKKRGFAEGKMNGVGGKVSVGESVEDAARRETFEEIGVKVKSLQKVAVLDFYFPHNRDWCQQVVVYEVRDWEGEPVETEEMVPAWYPFDEIPYEEMWADDIYWLPLILKGKKVNASFLFNENEEILDYTIEEISE